MTNQTNPTQSSEPVAWLTDDPKETSLTYRKKNERSKPLYTHPSPFTAELKAELLEALNAGLFGIDVAEGAAADKIKLGSVSSGYSIFLTVQRAEDKIRAAIALLEKVKP